MITSTTYTDNLANVPHPAGATSVGDWYGADSKSPGPLLRWQDFANAEYR
jgi:hypothetical protein